MSWSICEECYTDRLRHNEDDEFFIGDELTMEACNMVFWRRGLQYGLLVILQWNS
mgnify:FL=1